jgi:hypothetical protein
MSGRMILRKKIVRKVVFAAALVGKKFALGDSIFDLVERHVDSLGSTLFEGVAGDTGGAVFGLDQGWWLGPAHLGECGSKSDCFFAIEEQGSSLVFSC